MESREPCSVHIQALHKYLMCKLRSLQCNDCVYRRLHNWFSRYGKFLALHPLPFLIIPVLVAGLCGLGLISLTEESRNEYLFVPRNGRGWDERQTVKRLFPTNSSEFDGRRIADQGAAIRVMITAKSSDASVIRPEIVDEVLRLDGFITNLSIPWPYWSTCAKWRGKCVRDPFIQFLQKDKLHFLSLQFTFPTTEDGFRLGGSLGGVDFVSSNQIRNALAVRLEYWLQDNSVGQEWEKNALKQLEKFKSNSISVESVSATSIDDELNSMSDAVLPLFVIAFTTLITFAVLSLMMLDWVRSKLVVGLLGVLSPCLAWD